MRYKFTVSVGHRLIGGTTELTTSGVTEGKTIGEAIDRFVEHALKTDHEATAIHVYEVIPRTIELEVV